MYMYTQSITLLFITLTHIQFLSLSRSVHRAQPRARAKGSTLVVGIGHAEVVEETPLAVYFAIWSIYCVGTQRVYMYSDGGCVPACCSTGRGR